MDILQSQQNSNQSGMAVLLVVLFLSVLSFSIVVAIAFASTSQQRIAESFRASSQAYYGAEAGVEDALLKLKTGWSIEYPFVLNDEAFSTSVEVSEVDMGGTRTVTSQGEIGERIRRVQVTYGMSTTNISFHFGAHIGEGGLRMSNLSKVIGNVFSNGDMVASSGTEVQGSVEVAGTKQINGGNITENATVYTCNGASVGGVLTAVTNQGCSAASIEELEELLEEVPLAVTEQQISEWKEEAESGGVHEGNYTLSGSSQDSIGPLKINGNMVLSSSAQLTLMGAVWVTGNVTVQNLAVARLHSSYGSTSGVFLADGVITLQSLSESKGSGQSGSYLMYLSTSPANPAIAIKNNAKADILYTNRGWIEIQNNAKMRELTGYGIHTKNNAVVEYEAGLASSSFSSGPGGGWSVLSWEEVE